MKSSGEQTALALLDHSTTQQQQLAKKRSEETQTLRAGCTKA